MQHFYNYPSRIWQFFAVMIGLSCSFAVFAGSIVRIDTPLGSFRLELYDEQAPNTVANFLAYIESGQYHFTMTDYADASLISGGSYTFDLCSQGAQPISTNPAITAETNSFTNVAGTIAMVREPDNQATVRNRWIINLADNSALGTPATRPVVFGELIEGSNIVAVISNLWRVPMDISPAVPTLNYDGNLTIACGFFTRDNLVLLDFTIEEVPEPATPAVSFDESSGLLNVKVDIGEPQYYELSFSIAATTPEVVIQALPNTVFTLPGIVDKIATFDGVTGELYIPELVVGESVAFRDVRFQLTDAINLLFTLQSFAQ
ncbi:MAG: peptidylprolyl isomerase [Gammaproteobacteria bacterium]